MGRGAGGAMRMWAWRVHGYGGAAELRLEPARRPALRAPDELLVRVTAASLNPLDAAMLAGYGRVALNALRRLDAARGGDGVEFPLVPGRDFVGEVAAAGAATRLRRGDRVWGVLPPHWPGAHAQYAVVKERWAGAAPARGALAGAAAGGALYAGLTAASALRVGGLLRVGGPRPGRVLLLGLGGVGHMALQLLAYCGAQVVVGCAGELAERARAAGAEVVLDRHAPDYDRQLVDSGPYEAIVDCAGLGGREAAARRWRFGRYVTLSTPLLRHMDELGAAAGAARAAAELAAQCAAAAAPRLPPPHVRWAYFVPRADDIELLRRLAERDRLSVAVQAQFPWREAGAAHAAAAAGHARGKLLLDFTAD